MLLELRVQNLLLMERAELLLDPGLNVITGETGAGKTMLAHALDLLLGGKPRRSIVRPGADESYVEGSFAVPDGLRFGPELDHLRERVELDGDELLLARRITSEGRSSAYLEGRTVSAPDLRLIGNSLLSFYGQHEHRKLTLASAQLDVLDGFCGAKHLELRKNYEAAWLRATQVEHELQQLLERDGARQRDLDLLEFEIQEIEQAAPSEHEERELDVERRRLDSLESLRSATAVALTSLAGDSEPGAPAAADAIARAAGELQAVCEHDPQLAALAERCAALVVETRDLAGELADYSQSLEAEPGRLQSIAERLDLFARLKLKHGGSIAAVIEHGERCRTERDRLASAAERGERLERERDEARAELERLAVQMTATRAKAAPRLAGEVRQELAALAMADASFEIELSPAENGPGPKGAETVEFAIGPNPGVPAGALREIASGGELSRVMLALMKIASGAAGAATVVFDEVDAGVGGATARAVGESLRSVAAAKQVICITHLPQVASQADRHFRVTKSAQSGPGSTGQAIASTHVDRLDRAGTVEELCRMLGADPSDGAARKHAEQLLAAA